MDGVGNKRAYTAEATRDIMGSIEFIVRFIINALHCFDRGMNPFVMLGVPHLHLQTDDLDAQLHPMLPVTTCPSRFSLGAELQGHRSLGSRPTEHRMGALCWPQRMGQPVKSSHSAYLPASGSLSVSRATGCGLPGPPPSSVMRSRYLRHPAFPFHTQHKARNGGITCLGFPSFPSHLQERDAPSLYSPPDRGIRRPDKV